jgi:hypothetical protein
MIHDFQAHFFIRDSICRAQLLLLLLLSNLPYVDECCNTVESSWIVCQVFSSESFGAHHCNAVLCINYHTMKKINMNPRTHLASALLAHSCLFWRSLLMPFHAGPLWLWRLKKCTQVFSQATMHSGNVLPSSLGWCICLAHSKHTAPSGQMLTSLGFTGHALFLSSQYKRRWSYPCNRLWRPIGLWDVEAPTFSRHSAHRWRWGCQPYVPCRLLHLPPRKIPGTDFRDWVDPSAIVWLEGLDQLKNPVTTLGIESATFQLVT